MGSQEMGLTRKRKEDKTNLFNRLERKQGGPDRKDRKKKALATFRLGLIESCQEHH